MKTRQIILIPALIMLFFIAGCLLKDSATVRLTIVPKGALSISTPKDLNKASEIIRKRLNAFGIADEKINLEVSVDKMFLTINGIDTSAIEIIKGMATIPGELEFRETFENKDLINYLAEANIKTREMDLGEEFRVSETPVSDSTDTWESLLRENPDSAELAEKAKFRKENPLFSILIPQTDYEGNPLPSCMIGLANLEDTAMVSKILYMDEIRSLFPRDLKFLWSSAPYKYDESGKFYELHAIKFNSPYQSAPLDGKDIASSTVKDSRSGDNILDFSMTSQGAVKWSRITRENIDKCIAVVIDGYVYSYPRVLSEITGGNTEITGNFSKAEAQNLSTIFSSGGEVLPLTLEIASAEITGK